MIMLPNGERQWKEGEGTWATGQGRAWWDGRANEMMLVKLAVLWLFRESVREREEEEEEDEKSDG